MGVVVASRARASAGSCLHAVLVPLGDFPVVWAAVLAAEPRGNRTSGRCRAGQGERGGCLFRRGAAASGDDTAGKEAHLRRMPELTIIGGAAAASLVLVSPGPRGCSAGGAEGASVAASTGAP